MFSDHDETSPSIAGVSAVSAACSTLAGRQQQKKLCRRFVDVFATRQGCHTTMHVAWTKLKTFWVVSIQKIWIANKTNKPYGHDAMRHVRRAAIWTLGHKSKKPTRVDAYVDGEYCAQILANSITNCRTSRVWRDPLSRLDLTAATQQLMLTLL